MLHLYQYWTPNRTPREGDMAVCGHVRTADADDTSEERCPTCVMLAAEWRDDLPVNE